jgi:hypothetical protein
MQVRNAVLTAGAVLALAGCGTPPATPAPEPDTVVTGIPPVPPRDRWGAYIAALNAIDADIVGSKGEQALVDRGRDQCGSVNDWPDDQDKLLELTNKRFTAPDHPDGFGLDTAAKILAVVRAHLCPTY